MTADRIFNVGDTIVGDIPDSTAKVVKVNKKTVVVELSTGNHIHRHIYKHDIRLVSAQSAPKPADVAGN